MDFTVYLICRNNTVQYFKAPYKFSKNSSVCGNYSENGPLYTFQDSFLIHFTWLILDPN